MKPKTVIWKYFSKNGKNVICRFCNKQFFINASRMKQHLQNCSKTPAFVQKTVAPRPSLLAIAREEMSEMTESFSTGTTGSTGTSNSLDKSTRLKQGVLKMFVDEMSQTEIEKYQMILARAIFHSSTPLSIVENKEWIAFFKALRPTFVCPTRHEVSNTLLNKEYNKILEEVDSTIVNSKHLSLILDGWSNVRNEGVINFIVTTPKPMFVKSVETKFEKHTAIYIKGLIKEILQKYGESKFLCIITDNAANMRKAATDLENEYQHLTSYGCFAHTLHLLSGDILKTKSAANLFGYVKQIIKSITGSQVTVAVFQEIKRELNINKSLHLPAATRWASHAESLNSLLECQCVLKRMAIDPRVKEKVEKKNFILNDEFWIRVSDLKNIIDPIVKWIKILEGDTPTIAYVCKAFQDLENVYLKLIPVFFNEEEGNKIKKQFFDRKCNVIKPIHFAADFLNPLSMGVNLTDEEKNIAMNFIEKISTDLELDTEKIILEIGYYMAQEGPFSSNYMWKAAKKISPLFFWKGYAKNTCISTAAVRILSMPSTSASVERSFSSQSIIHSKRRNRLTTERAIKLNFIRHNYKILDFDKEIAGNVIDLDQKFLNLDSQNHRITTEDILTETENNNNSTTEQNTIDNDNVRDHEEDFINDSQNQYITVEDISVENNNSSTDTETEDERSWHSNISDNTGNNEYSDGISDSPDDSDNGINEHKDNTEISTVEDLKSQNLKEDPYPCIIESTLTNVKQLLFSPVANTWTLQELQK